MASLLGVRVMNRSISLRSLVGGALLGVGVLALTGCVVAPVGAYHGQPYGYGYGEAVGVAPPPIQGEVIGVAPFPGYLWIGGYWGWSGGRHVWNRGRWSSPREGHRWEAHRWERADRGGWRERPGRWERR